MKFIQLLTIASLTIFATAPGVSADNDDLTDDVFVSLIATTVAPVSAPDVYADGLPGNVPTQLGQLTNLLVLETDFNHLCGSIPSELGQLKNPSNLQTGIKRTF